MPFSCEASPQHPGAPGRVGDRLPSRAGEASRDGSLLVGADSACALRRAAAAALPGVSAVGWASGTEDWRSKRWIASTAAWLVVERGETLEEAEVGEATDDQLESASATAAASAPAPLGALADGILPLPIGMLPLPIRGSMVRHASERGRSSAATRSAELLVPSSAEPLMLDGIARPPAGYGSGGRLGAAAAPAAAAMAASSPGLMVLSVRAALRSSRLANSWFSGMRFSCTAAAAEGDRMPELVGDSAPLPPPRGEAAVGSRPACFGEEEGQQQNQEAGLSG